MLLMKWIDVEGVVALAIGVQETIIEIILPLFGV